MTFFLWLLIVFFISGSLMTYEWSSELLICLESFLMLKCCQGPKTIIVDSSHFYDSVRVSVFGCLENVDKADAYQVAGVLVCLWSFLNIQL